MFYGPCPEEEKDESKLVIERFTYRAKKAHGRYMAGLPKYHRSKNIYNTEHLFWPSVHFAVYGTKIIEFQMSSFYNRSARFCT